MLPNDILYEYDIEQIPTASRQYLFPEVSIREVIRDETRDSHGSWKLVNEKEGKLIEGGGYWEYHVYKEPCSNYIDYYSHVFHTPQSKACHWSWGTCYIGDWEITTTGEEVEHWSYNYEEEYNCNGTIQQTYTSLLNIPQVIVNSSVYEEQYWMIINNPLPSPNGFMPPGSCANWWTHYNEETDKTVTCED